MKEIKDYIDGMAALLPVAKSISVVEAERRAGEFLAALAHLANWRHMMSEDKIRCLSVQTAVYAQQMAAGTDKTVTVNKLNAEASPEYTEAREALERIENDVSYLKAYTDIFMSAHVFYRHMAKGENL